MENEEVVARKHYSIAIERANKLSDLLKNQNFIDLFQTHFMDDYATTQIKNYSVLKPEQREKVQENMIGRSVFAQFINTVEISGNMATVALQELDSPQNNDDISEESSH